MGSGHQRTRSGTWHMTAAGPQLASRLVRNSVRANSSLLTSLALKRANLTGSDTSDSDSERPPLKIGKPRHRRLDRIALHNSAKFTRKACPSLDKPSDSSVLAVPGAPPISAQCNGVVHNPYQPGKHREISRTLPNRAILPKIGYNFTNSIETKTRQKLDDILELLDKTGPKVRINKDNIDELFDGYASSDSSSEASTLCESDSDSESVIQIEHDKNIGEHEKYLGEHGKNLGEHDKNLGEHDKNLGEHRQSTTKADTKSDSEIDKSANTKIGTNPVNSSGTPIGNARIDSAECAQVKSDSGCTEDVIELENKQACNSGSGLDSQSGIDSVLASENQCELRSEYNRRQPVARLPSIYVESDGHKQIIYHSRDVSPGRAKSLTKPLSEPPLDTSREAPHCLTNNTEYNKERRGYLITLSIIKESQVYLWDQWLHIVVL